MAIKRKSKVSSSTPKRRHKDSDEPVEHRPIRRYSIDYDDNGEDDYDYEEINEFYGPGISDGYSDMHRSGGSDH